MSAQAALWDILPYLAISVFLLGHIWRYRWDRFGWTDEWMQLLKPRKARWGIVLFHVGTFAVIAGHVFGILVPQRLTADIGIGEQLYRVIAVSLGGVFGLCIVVGLGAFLWRRTMVAQIVANTTLIDLLTLGLLTLVVVLGMTETLGVNLLGGGYDYRLTVAVWFRSILTFSPQAQLMSGVPVVYQLHAIAAWLVVIIWPFSRLVHVWYAPFYLRRRWSDFRRDRSEALVEA